MEPLIIHEKRKISAKSVCFCVIMLLICAYLAWFGSHEGGFFYLILGIIGLLYFGFCLILALLSLAKTPAILTFEEEGLRGLGSASALDFIAYEDIGQVESFRRLQDQYIGITPKDTEAFLAKLPPAKREAARANLRLNLPPFFVRVEDAVELTPEEITQEIRRRLPQTQTTNEGLEI